MKVEVNSWIFKRFYPRCRCEALLLMIIITTDDDYDNDYENNALNKDNKKY